MLVSPKIEIVNELGAIVLEVEDEGTLIRVDITEKVLEIIEEINNS